MSKESNKLEDDLVEFVKEGVRGKSQPGDKAVVASFKKALESTTPERPGDPRDAKDSGKKKEKLEWW